MKFNWFILKHKEILEKKEVLYHEEKKFQKGKHTDETAKILAVDLALMGVL